MDYRLSNAAKVHLADIYNYSWQRWGAAQARRYLDGIYDRLDQVAAKQIPWRTIPTYIGVEGYYTKYERHFIYWRLLCDGMIGVAAVLHERMHHSARLAPLFADDSV
jgi:toxin ParE1/3/4